MEKKNENDVPETLHGMTLGNIAEACGGTYIGAKEQEEQEITGAVTDSRQVKTGYLFIPIRGARVDGHDFIQESKKDLADSIINGDHTGMGSLSKEELLELLEIG